MDYIAVLKFHQRFGCFQHQQLSRLKSDFIEKGLNFLSTVISKFGTEKV